MYRFLLIVIAMALVPSWSRSAEPTNPRIDYHGFAQQVVKIEEFRKERRISESEFAKKAAQAGVIILDARSREKFALLHIKGSVNLPLPDITTEELRKIIPEKDTTVLIYCNNNFRDDPVAFPSKLPTFSLNIHTFNVLYGYGYENIFELAPLLDVSTSKLNFGGSRSTSRTPASNNTSG